MKILIKILFFLLFAGFLLYRQDVNTKIEETFTAFTIDARTAKIEFYRQNDAGENFGSLENLKQYAVKQGKKLRFAMNGGMYQEDRKPLGLFIQNGTTVTQLNNRTGSGNFYLPPNGVFYITNKNKVAVVQTANFQSDGDIKYATQSGPLLLINGEINQAFTPDSSNVYIRNGVCVLDDNKIIFAISRRRVNFYEFAAYFKNAGCRNALYLDGFVSRMYAPEENITQTDGNFGVIIGIVE